MTEDHRRVALITGGSSGLGLAMARRLAVQGYTPVILARNPDRLDAAVASLKQTDKAACGFACDVTRFEALTGVADTVRSRFSTIHFLILNAGVVHVNLLEDVACIDDLRADIETDLWGVVLSARVLTPLVAPLGRVLCISSGFGLMGAAGYAAYCAAKAGVVNFAAALRRELLHRRITVYVACPSDIDTPQFQAEQAAMPSWMRRAPVRGKVMTPERAAEKILRKCAGDRFLILINFEIRLLMLLNRLLPLRWVNAILDRMFPRPSQTHRQRHNESLCP